MSVPGSNQYARRHTAGPAVPWPTPVAPGLDGLPLQVRLDIACSPSTSQAYLVQLAHDREPQVRQTVARNYQSPPEALAVLSQDTNVAVRREAARHAACPPGQLRTLCYHDSTMLPVADNPACPPELIVWLAQHGARRAVGAQYRNRQGPVPPRLAGSTCQAINKHLAGRFVQLDQCPPKVLAWALQYDTPQDWVGQGDKQAFRTSIAYNLAQHPSCPGATLAELLRHPSPEVQRQAATHPGCPRAALAMWQLAKPGLSGRQAAGPG
jgi:hypothetical protein